MMNANTDVGSSYERREGPVAKAIEKQTSKLPSDFFLWSAGAAMLGSMAFQIFKGGGKKSFFGNIPSRGGQLSLFIGQWVPTLMLFGIYNKIVKVAGSDKYGSP